MLHGHERAITQIKYNREGDLLFTAAKDQTPNVWFSINGERLGTFKGHNGAVWTIDVNCILYKNTASANITNIPYRKKIFTGFNLPYSHKPQLVKCFTFFWLYM